MLVITRKLDETVILEANGERIEISVLELARDKVKLGVKAPRNVKIMRSELLAAKTLNVEASRTVSPNVLDAFLNSVKSGENGKSQKK